MFEDSRQGPVSTKLKASGIGGAPPQHYTIEQEGPKLCAAVSPNDF